MNQRTFGYVSTVSMTRGVPLRSSEKGWILQTFSRMIHWRILPWKLTCPLKINGWKLYCPYCLLKGCPFLGDMNRWFSVVYHCQGTWSSTTFKPLNLTNASGVPSVGGHLHPLNKAGDPLVVSSWDEVCEDLSSVNTWPNRIHQKKICKKRQSLYTCYMLHLQTKKQISRRSWLLSLSDFSTIAKKGKDWDADGADADGFWRDAHKPVTSSNESARWFFGWWERLECLEAYKVSTFKGSF